MKKRILTAVLAGASLFLLTGCEEEERKKAKYNNPEVSKGIEIEGCIVKFVDRGYAMESFFLAKCDNTTTITSNFSVSQGKSSYDARRTIIINEIEKLNAEKKALDKQAKEEALNHLRGISKEEREELMRRVN